MTPFAEAEAEPGPEKTLCTHCGEPVGRGPGLLDRLQSQGKRAAGVDAPAAADIETDPEAIDLSSSADDQFCCGGCRAAHALIQGAGLSTYYDRRSVDPEAKSLRPDETGPVDFAAHVRLDPLSGKAAASTPAAGKGAPEGATEGAPEDALAVPRTASLSLMVEGLHCAACVWLIETLLGRNPHVLKGRVNMTTRRLSLQWSVPEGAGEDLGINQILAPIQAIGYRLMPYDPGMLDQEAKKEEAHLMRAMAVAGFASGNVMLFSVSVWFGFDMDEATRTLMHWLSALVAIPAVLYAIRPFAKSAIQALRARRSNMDVPITVAVILATAVSLWETARSGPHAYFDAAVMLLFFLLVGRFLDVRARSKARSAAEHLVTLGAGSVTLERPDGSQARVPPAAVQPGMTVLVAAGERVGVDGTVQDGRSDLDMSLLTGESLPVAVDKGGQVFAGTLNLSGPLRLTAEAVGESTVLAEIVRLMEGAEQGRARYVALADRVARGYVPVVHALAAVSFLAWVLIGGMVWQQAILIAAAVLIVTCPCALALAVPVVQVVATGRLMRRGILVKSPTALERLTTVDHLVFDKTGTLTLGRLTLQTGPQENWTAPDLTLAARLARTSRHPLARAVVRGWHGYEQQAADGIDTGPESVLCEIEELPGRGLQAALSDGRTVRLGSRAFCGPRGGDADPETAGGALPDLWLAVTDATGGQHAARFRFADQIRPDAAQTLARLQHLGLGVEILSGDRAEVVGAVAEDLACPTWRAGCSPATKTARLETLAQEGRTVLMVGDGLNDAPALAAAHVSLSPSDAADITRNAADLVFQGDSLSAVLDVLEVSRRADRLVRQNFFLSFAYNVITVPLAVAGYVTPLIAAVAMSGSSVAVIVNALRLSRVPKPSSRPPVPGA